MKFKYLMIDGDGKPFAVMQSEHDKELHLYDSSGVEHNIIYGIYKSEFVLARFSLDNYRNTRNVEL